MKPPKKNKKKEVARAVIEATAQCNPVTGALARIYQTTHPSEAEQDRDRWAQEVTAAVNGLLQPPRGTISAMDCRDDFGIAAITDEGIGRCRVALVTAMEDEYHVSTELPRGQANVRDKKPTGFLIVTAKNGEPIDTEVSIHIL